MAQESFHMDDKDSFVLHVQYNVCSADELAVQGARALAAMVLT